jgi:hypothetical protein
MQSPAHVSSLHLHERKYDSNTNEWTTEQGDAFTVERLMPVPYTLGLTLDIWASNTDQKLQLIEQIATLFNPAIEIQNTDNYVDWTSLSAVFLENTTWTTKTVPAGASEVIDVATYKFTLPIWLTAPAKIKKMGAIHSMIANMYTEDGALDGQIIDAASPVTARPVFTPMIGILYTGNTLKLLQDRESVPVSTGAAPPPSWQNLLRLYGTMKPGITEVRLLLDSGNELIGTVALHPSDDSLLLYSPFNATMPVNTLSPINAIIDPRTTSVSSIPNTAGARLLILNDIGDEINVSGPVAWRGSDNTDLVARANDIIEFDGTRWFVSFSPSANDVNKYFTNLTSNEQYRWNGSDWVKSIHGVYQGGRIRIVL